MIYGPERLPPGTYSASPVLADGKIYVTGEHEGMTTVFSAGPKFEILASNSLGDGCSPYCLSTVAISQGQLFIRLERASVGDWGEKEIVEAQRLRLGDSRPRWNSELAHALFSFVAGAIAVVALIRRRRSPEAEVASLRAFEP